MEEFIILGLRYALFVQRPWCAENRSEGIVLLTVDTHILKGFCQAVTKRAPLTHDDDGRQVIV
jgi:hypothetical protein